LVTSGNRCEQAQVLRLIAELRILVRRVKGFFLQPGSEAALIQSECKRGFCGGSKPLGVSQIEQDRAVLGREILPQSVT
jgi:hypothetical protein